MFNFLVQEPRIKLEWFLRESKIRSDTWK